MFIDKTCFIDKKPSLINFVFLMMKCELKFRGRLENCRNPRNRFVLWRLPSFPTLFIDKKFCIDKNCFFDKNALIARFCLCFRRPKRRKSMQNSNPKTCFFDSWNLKGFSSNFRCILESKNHQEIANIRKKWCLKASSLALSL